MTPLIFPSVGTRKIFGFRYSRSAPATLSRYGGAFTLIELILVMAILTIAVAITGPALANFFHSRTLDSEARRLLSLTRHGQNRAVSEGLPMELWFDAQQGAFGLEAEPSYAATDPKAVSFNLDKEMQLEVASVNALNRPEAVNASRSVASAPRRTNHPNLPAIHFLPDGALDAESPESIRLTGRDGLSIWLVLSRNRLNYEIRTHNNQAD